LLNGQGIVAELLIIVFSIDKEGFFEEKK
jgi:hypothetical protein